jgi:hypothetical protein
MTTVPPSYAAPNAPPAQPPKSKWGCGRIALVGCSILTVIGVIGCAALLVLYLGMVKSTGAYKDARDRAVHDPRVIAALGNPVKAGWWVTGSVNIDDKGGFARIEFPISGSKAGGKVEAHATHDTDNWKFVRLIVHPDSGPDIDLLNPPAVP